MASPASICVVFPFPLKCH